MSAIYSTQYAFAALKTDGSVVAWGMGSYGGDSSSVSSLLASGVSAISSTGFAFAALKTDGSVVTWGMGSHGGDSSSVSSLLASGVSAIYSTAGAFATLPASPAAQASGDPHLVLAHGGKADFRGTDKGIYNFLSAKNVSLNVMTEFADFYLHDTDHPRHKLVHGSFLTQAHIVALTGGGHTVRASFWASKIGPLNIGWMNATIDSQQAFALGPHTTKVVDDVSLHMDYSSLHVTTGEWELAVSHRRLSNARWRGPCGASMCR